MSVTASQGRLGNPAATTAAVCSIDSCSGLVLIGGPGVSANGTWSKTSPSLGCFSTTTAWVGASGLSHSDHCDRPERAAVGVVGQARGRRRVVQRVHVSGQLAVGDRAEQPHVPLRLARLRRLVPVGDDLRRLGDEDVAVVGPFVDGIVDPVEVRPPERLVLASVEPPGRGDHRDGRLLGGPRLRRRHRRTCTACGRGRRRVRPPRRRAPVGGPAAGHRIRWRAPSSSRAGDAWTGSRRRCSPRSP